MYDTGRDFRSSCFDRDVERIVAYVEDKVAPAANGVGIFACAGADVRHVILAGDTAMVPVLEETLPKQLAELVVVVMKLDGMLRSRKSLPPLAGSAGDQGEADGREGVFHCRRKSARSCRRSRRVSALAYMI